MKLQWLYKKKKVMPPEWGVTRDRTTPITVLCMTLSLKSWIMFLRRGVIYVPCYWLLPVFTGNL